MDEEKFVADEARLAAVKRLERSLILDEIAKIEKIEVTKDHLDNTFQQTWYEMSGSEDFQKYLRGKSQPPKQLLNAVAMESANRAYLQQTLERIKLIATGEAPDLGADIKAEEPKAKKSPSKKTSQKKKTVAKESAPVSDVSS
jgi:FKBP-type peptidyl-prolyl cis-trans isomerase (trigger factor)